METERLEGIRGSRQRAEGRHSRRSSPERTAHWRRVLVRFSESGQTAQEFCKKECIGRSTLDYWRKRVETQEPVHSQMEANHGVQPHWVNLPVIRPKKTGQVAGRPLLISVAGVDVGFSPSTPPEWVAAVVLGIARGREGQC